MCQVVTMNILPYSYTIKVNISAVLHWDHWTYIYGTEIHKSIFHLSIIPMNWWVMGNGNWSWFHLVPFGSDGLIVIEWMVEKSELNNGNTWSVTHGYQCDMSSVAWPFITGKNVVQANDLHLPIFPKPSNASSKPKQTHKLDAMMEADQVELVQQLGGDVQLLIQHSCSAEDVAAPAVAWLASMTLELCQMQTALHLKEQWKKMAQGCPFPGGQ